MNFRNFLDIIVCEINVWIDKKLFYISVLLIVLVSWNDSWLKQQSTITTTKPAIAKY